jgi:hypothetical protein
MLRSFAGWLAGSRLGHPAGLAALAVLLTAGSLGSGLAIDDFAHREVIRGSGLAPPGLRGDPLHLYSFFVSTEQARALRDDGLAPWWTPDSLRIAFFRPLSAATILLDHALWRDREWLMHAHSLLWFAGLVAAAATAYRMFDPHLPRACLAGLLFAIDDAGGVPAGWIANRHVLLGGLFGLLAVIAWSRRRPGLALLSFAIALAASESAVAAGAGLFAFSVFDEGTLRGRWLRLLPFVAIGLVWLALYSGLGYGSHGSGTYLHPLQDAPAFLAALPGRVALCLLGAWGLPPPELALLPTLRPYVLAWAAAVGAGVLALVGWLVRRQPEARPWALWLALALVPACASVPELRSLLFVRLASMPLIAGLLLSPVDASGWLRRAAWRSVVVVLAAVHLVVAPIALPLAATMPWHARAMIRAVSSSWPQDAAFATRHLVALDVPIYLAFFSFSRFDRAVVGGPVPLTARALVSGPPRPMRVTRLDAETLLVSALRDPFVSPFDLLFRGRPFVEGETVGLPGIEVTVTGVTAGRLREARFRFDAPLEDRKWVWVRWRDGRYVPFVPPPPGTSVVVDRGSEPERP